MEMNTEDDVMRELLDLQKRLGRKQTFEESVSHIRNLFKDWYPSASTSLRSSFYSAIRRVATILQSRYTIPGFWLAGLRLFEEANFLISENVMKENLKTYIARAREHLHDIENISETSESTQSNSGFLFEGHLTVGQEPPPPAWLVAQNFLTTIAATQDGAFGSPLGQDQNSNASGTVHSERASELLRNLIDNLQERDSLQNLESIIETSLQEIGAGPWRPPPASKDVVAKLPIIVITDAIIAELGNESECAVCKDKLVINDKMQELPCKHLFHPDCLKPWLDEHNSCPICRHELPTDDHEYESWKEREKEAEEERIGAANAVRGGEYMYV